VAVDIVVDGLRRTARMSENSFGLRIDDAPVGKLEKVVLHRRDGTRRKLDLRMPRPEAAG
jgi:hypothetical protein